MFEKTAKRAARGAYFITLHVSSTARPERVRVYSMAADGDNSTQRQRPSRRTADFCRGNGEQFKVIIRKAEAAREMIQISPNGGAQSFRRLRWKLRSEGTRGGKLRTVGSSRGGHENIERQACRGRAPPRSNWDPAYRMEWGARGRPRFETIYELEAR